MISTWQKLFTGQFGKQDLICEESPKWQLKMKKRMENNGGHPTEDVPRWDGGQPEKGEEKPL